MIIRLQNNICIETFKKELIYRLRRFISILTGKSQLMKVKIMRYLLVYTLSLGSQRDEATA